IPASVPSLLPDTCQLAAYPAAAQLHREASNRLEDRGDALPAADAHRHQRVAPADPLQLVQRLDGDQRAGRADRMAERNARAVRVQLRRIEAQFLADRASLR